MSILVESTTGALGKRISRSVSADGSALFAIKWDRYAINDEAGGKATTATVEQKAVGLEFVVSGSGDDTQINAYTSSTGAAGNVVYGDTNAATVEEVLAVINGVAPGQAGELVNTGPPNTGGAGVQAGYSTRWRAGLGDFRPGFAVGTTTGLVVAAANGNAMLGGESAGLTANGDTSGLETADLYSVGLGTGKAQSGGGQTYADHFQSDYFSDTSGNRFRRRNTRRMRESQPGLSEFRVAITAIRADMVYASGTKIVTIYDIDNNVLGVFPIAANVDVDSITEDTPFVGPAGSPLFVEVTGSGVLTDGPLTVTGAIRIA